MSYAVVQTRRFARQYKKLHDNVATNVDDAVELVARKPSIGEQKKVTWLICLSTNFTAKGNFICWVTHSTMVCSWFIWKPLALTKFLL